MQGMLLTQGQLEHELDAAGMGGDARHVVQYWLAWQATNVWRAHPLLIQGDLLGEALLGKVPHSIVISVCQEVCQLVLSLGILLPDHILVESTQEVDKTRDMASPCDGRYCGHIIVSMVG